MYIGRVVDGRIEEGLGFRVVKDLIRKFVNKFYVVYMDKFFISLELFECLLYEDIYCCGIVRINRRGMLEVIKGVKLKKRGESFVV